MNQRARCLGATPLSTLVLLASAHFGCALGDTNGLATPDPAHDAAAPDSIDDDTKGRSDAIATTDAADAAAPDTKPPCGPTSDVTSDPQNCGKCGHDCGATGCIEGRCQVEDVAYNLTSVFGLAVDTQYVYWGLRTVATTKDLKAKNGSIVKCAHVGCDNAPTDVVKNLAPNSFAIDATNVYYTEFVYEPPSFVASVSKCALAGCTKPTVIYTSKVPDHVFQSVVVSGGEIFWTDRGSGTMQLEKCAVTGCDAPTVLGSVGGSDCYEVAVDGGDVFVASLDGVYRCSIAGCGTATRIASGSFIGSVVARGPDVYYGDLNTGVWKVPRDGSAEPKKFSDGARPGGLAFEGTDLFVADRGTGWFADGSDVRQIALSSGTEATVIDKQKSAFIVRADPANLYWVNEGTKSAPGSISRLTR